MATEIDPKRINTELGTQIRVDWNEDAVKEYAEAMERSVEFPPLLVFYDEPNNRIILADGFHRLAAHKQVRPDEPILVEQRFGDVEDARWAAIIANQSHGIRRTTDDKRNAIKEAFLHPRSIKKSTRLIAEELGLPESTVRVVRKELESTAQIAQSGIREGRDGRMIDTTRIGGESKENDEKNVRLFPVNTSRINFGGKIVPEGATCVTCRFS